MQIGSYSVESIVDGFFGLDGGSMFGIVPKPLWSKTNPADEQNRIELAARCLLLEGEGRRILVDTGLGAKNDAKQTEIFKVRRPDDGLPGALSRRGIAAEEITDVILTHLHFDHCGGTTQHHESSPASDELSLTFPEAVHHLQRRNWEWAWNPSGKDAGSFRKEDFSPLENSDKLRLIDGDTELFPGIHLHVVDGHTPAMQLVRIASGGSSLVFLADLVPTRSHLKWPYIMAYDNEPLVTLGEKRDLLPLAAAEGWIVAFQHDPECAAATLRAEGDRVLLDQMIDL
jgi:glyoxylase-like metal-dependent hydrolase (beta-lactamase superfamily II)